jgi:hypothetical protein
MKYQILLAAATAALAASIGFVSEAQAFVYFDPAGSPLDGDPTNDLLATPGDNFTFNLGFDLSVLNPALLPDTLNFTVQWDDAELALANALGEITTTISGTGNTRTVSVAGINSATSTNFLVGSFGFQAIGPLVNDGAADFSTSFNLGQLSATLGNSQIVQSVDVQAVPTPALLPGLLGLGVAALRNKTKQTAEDNA